MSAIRTADDAYAAGAALGAAMPPLTQAQADYVAAVLAASHQQKADAA